jgi:extradiol dioxygenase family protein
MVLSTLPDIFCLAIPVRDQDITEQFYAGVSARAAALAGEYRTFAPPAPP